jgi:hypothetical protein
MTDDPGESVELLLAGELIDTFERVYLKARLFCTTYETLTALGRSPHPAMRYLRMIEEASKQYDDAMHRFEPFAEKREGTT